MSNKAPGRTASGGTAVTEELLEQSAEEWENDSWSGRLVNVTVGRPRIAGEELVNVTFRIPKSRLGALDAMASRKGESRSEYLRNAVDQALVADA
jgi:hypothetical protein